MMLKISIIEYLLGAIVTADNQLFYLHTFRSGPRIMEIDVLAGRTTYL